ncbi:MAG: ParB/RepB/Spo0J family partition protein [Gemmataceae bacterium]|nr:ParB/RepB/Spo0J family partition protein [Gemmataceae bacterium]
MDKRRMGRGLDALLGGADLAVADLPGGEVPLDKIEQNPWQPRKSFDPDELASLSASVKTHGILQPLVVRSIGDRFQLIAGERRLRAAQQAGLSKVPVRVVDFNDQQVLEAALVENIQRSDLNPIEKAQGFKEHIDRFQLNHEQLAQRLGLARSTITNLINLLELAPEVQEGVRLGQLTEAHAKLLKGVKGKDKQVSLFKQVVALGLSVKATETLIREQKDGAAGDGERGHKEPGSRSASSETKTAHVKSLENDLRQQLATMVEIRVLGKDKGQFVINFESNDDFERILARLQKG